LEETLNWKS